MPTPGSLRPLDHAGLVLGEARIVEVAVAVDDHAASGSTWRGKMPAGAGSAVPAGKAVPRAAKERSDSGTARRSSSFAEASGMKGWVRSGQAAQGLGQDPEHGRHAGGVGLAQGPGRLGVDVAVGGTADLPDLLQGTVRGDLGHAGASAAEQGVGRVEQGLVGVGERAGLGHHAAAVLGDHRQHALGEVAVVVGEVVVDAADHGGVAEVAVAAEGDLAQEEVAGLVQAVLLDQRGRAHHVAQGLGHLLALDRPPAMGEDLLAAARGRRSSGRPASRRRGSAGCPCRRRGSSAGQKVR